MTEPRITQSRSAFAITCRVDVNVRAPAARIWALLTDAKGFPRWNSTVVGIDGDIRDGATIRIHVPGTDRTFTPTIAVVVPNERMTWTGGLGGVFKGVRTFELRSRGDGSTDFSMAERFSGVMLPFAQRAMPDFGPVFARYAGDLKAEAERATG